MQQWRKWLLVPVVALSIPLALAGMQSVTSRAEAAVSGQTKARVWPAWTKVGTKLVPILSVGTPGVRLGIAQVSGPETQVGLVKAVLQLDAEFKGARAKIFVPSDSVTDLRRVNGTAVSAVVQYGLIDFTKPSARGC
jgi:hypothetical protein